MKTIGKRSLALFLLLTLLAALGGCGYVGYKGYRHYINKKRGYAA